MEANGASTAAQVAAPAQSQSVKEEEALVPVQRGEVIEYEPSTFTGLMRQASVLARSGLIPAHLQGKPADVMVTLLWGREIGLSSIQALTSLFVIKGRAGMYAQRMQAMCIARKDICEYFEPVESNAQRATYVTKRVGRPEFRLTYTMDEAVLAGLPEQNPNYKKYPAQMLAARCVSNIAKQVFPDILNGLVEAEEVREIEMQATAIPDTFAPAPPSPAQQQPSSAANAEPAPAPTRRGRRSNLAAVPAPQAEPVPAPAPVVQPAPAPPVPAEPVAQQTQPQPAQIPAPVPPPPAPPPAAVPAPANTAIAKQENDVAEEDAAFAAIEESQTLAGLQAAAHKGESLSSPDMRIEARVTVLQQGFRMLEKLEPGRPAVELLGFLQTVRSKLPPKIQETFRQDFNAAEKRARSAQG